MINVKVGALSYDPITHSPLLVLQSLDEKYLLPLWIGPFEANAILMALEGIEAPRPLIHKTLFNIIKSTTLKLEKVVIGKTQEMEGGQAFLCDMILRDGKKKVVIDCRPSDAIAVAIMAEAPILVDEDIMEKSGMLHDSKKISKESMKKVLEELTPEDFNIPDDGKVH